MRCDGCNKIIWFGQFKSWGWGDDTWIHCDWDGDSKCRRLSWNKYIKTHPEESNPVSDALASSYD